MHRVWIIARNELEITLQGKQSWLLLVVVPVVTIYLVGLGTEGLAGSVMPNIRIDVLDLDRSPTSRLFIDGLEQSNRAFIVCEAQPHRVTGEEQVGGARMDASGAECLLNDAPLSARVAQERLADGITSALVTLPPGFDAVMGPTGVVTVAFQAGADMAGSEIAFGAVQNVGSRMGAPIVAARLSTQMAESQGIDVGGGFFDRRRADAEALWGSALPVAVNTQLSGPNEKLAFGTQLLENGFRLSAPSITAMFVMVSVLGMTQALAEERTRGILERVGTMPVRKRELLGGKLLAVCSLGMAQFTILVIAGEALGVDFGAAFLAVLLAGGAYVLAVAALAVALATVAPSPNLASALATATWVVLVPLGGGWWPLLFVPRWLRLLGHLSPVAWALDAMYAVVFHDGSMVDVLVPVAALLVFAGVCLVAGVKNLNYSRPTGADIGFSLPYFGARDPGPGGAGGG